MPLEFDDFSELEPDFTVVTRQTQRGKRHPKTALLVIEVSNPSLRFDRGRKPGKPFLVGELLGRVQLGQEAPGHQRVKLVEVVGMADHPVFAFVQGPKNIHRLDLGGRAAETA